MNKPGQRSLRLNRGGPAASRRAFLMAAAASGLALAAGCNVRDSKWDAGIGQAEPVGLSGSVAIYDEALDRMLFLTSEKQGELTTTSFPVGLNVTNVQRSADLSQLYVLSEGIQPRVEADDERPRLIVFDGGTNPNEFKSFDLDDPMRQLAIDPQGQWLIAYAGDGVVSNANELVFLNLSESADEVPISKTIRSFGGSPEEIIFTDELTVPGGARRFVVVRTDRDITLIDLNDLSAQEVTIPMPDDDNQDAIPPVQVVFDDGDPDETNDSRLAVRLSNSADVMLLQLGEATESDKDFSVIPNIVDVGGVPSTIEFVRTDGGLRLAALVPGARRATLVNPETTLAESVELPNAFNQMTRITSIVDETDGGGDVALLWGSSSSIAFWSLGSTSATPYRSVDSTVLDVQIAEVIDVPAPNNHLKVLVSPSNSSFFVLDLEKRESFPLDTRGSGFDVQVSPDGARLWVAQQYSSEFSAVDLENLHPEELYVQPGINQIFDIERSDGGRSAIAFHDTAHWSATVIDAQNPDSAQTAYYPALEMEGLQ